MKNRNALLRSSLVLLVGFLTMFSLSACKSTDDPAKKSEHPTKENPASEHPTSEHPTSEHPTSNAPTKP